MADDELRTRLVKAADDFPVRGWRPDLHRRVVRRQRRIRATFVSMGVAVVVGVAVTLPLVVGRNLGIDHQTPEPAATTTAVTTAVPLIGSSWTLTAVDDGHTTVTIPASVGAHMELSPDGRIYLNDGTGSLSGRFTTVSGGFEVTGTVQMYSKYNGSDPAKTKAAAALSTVGFGNPEGLQPTAAVRNTVVRLDATRLVLAAGPLRLTFSYAGPARSLPPPATGTTR